MFQVRFYSDVGKTVEITGLNITLSSVVVRLGNVSNLLLDAYAGSGALTFDDGGSGAIGTPAENSSNVYLGGTSM